MLALLPTLLSIGSDLIGGHLFSGHRDAGGGLNPSTLIPLAAGLAGRFVPGFLLAAYLFDQPFRDCLNSTLIKVVEGLF